MLLERDIQYDATANSDNGQFKYIRRTKDNTIRIKGDRPFLKYIAEDGQVLSDKIGWGGYGSPENLAHNTGRDFGGLLSNIEQQHYGPFANDRYGHGDPAAVLAELGKQHLIGLGVGAAIGYAFRAFSPTMVTVYRGTKFENEMKTIKSGYLFGNPNRIGPGKTGFGAKFWHSFSSGKSAYVSTSNFKWVASNFAGRSGHVYKFQVPRNQLNMQLNPLTFIEFEFLARKGTRIYNVTRVK